MINPTCSQTRAFSPTAYSTFWGYLTVLTLLLVLGGTDLAAQNRDAYGVWARGKNFDLKKFPYKGVEFDQPWSEVEPREGVFDWSELDARLKEAVKEDIYVFISINVGPDSPQWLFGQGIAKIMTAGHRHVGPYPDYFNPQHIAYYHRLIAEFGRHTRSLPAELTKRIVFVQAKTGATGDESPYKGEVTNAAFKISPAKWNDYRLVAFKKFHTAFQEGPGPIIPIMYTSIINEDTDDYALLKWVSADVKGGWGTKMGGTGQNYQINGEVERTRAVLNHTVDPAPGVYELFTRCEMDQGWKEGIFAKNIKQGFYWTSISAIHSGLSMWNVTESARDWHAEQKYWEDLEFFNRYAGQTRAAQATHAFSALREGLDAADTVKFPEGKFGQASIKNADRYLAICASLPAYGAKMDDVSGVLAGMMKQRRGQEGLNDSGWDIFPGNYERFLHQIDADQTSVGWWRVGGEITADSPVHGRFARGFEHKSGKDVMAFDIKDAFFSAKSPSASGAISVRVVYYDQGHGQWSLSYDAVDDPDKIAAVITKTNTGEWKEVSVTLTDARFDNRGRNGGDLALVNTDAEDDIFHLIEIERQP
jgi:hypothetical protein